ncbi:MAG: DUF4105 domain-containing protein [Ignavibacteriaceae bacterium]
MLASANNGIENNKLDDTTTTNQEWKLFYNDHIFNKLYLVFAGPFPASPTSSFGHIFVLLEPKKERPFLLWDAIDFSANITNIGTFEYLAKGLLGSLEGQYKEISFYEKLREYTLKESRSLWLFPIQLDKEESKNFLFRFFNLSNKICPYRFTNSNCASQIYNLIKLSIDESFKQENQLVFPHTIINGLKNRISDPIFIESIDNLLKENAKKITLNTCGSENKLLEYNNVNDAILLNKLEWEYSQDRDHLTAEEKINLQKLRKKVSLSNGNGYNNFKSYPKEFNIHPTTLAGSGLQISKREGIEYLLMYRFGIHEYFENCNVYPANDYLSLLKLELGIKKKEIKINQLMLFSQTSLQPTSYLSNYLSWKLGFGIQKKYEFRDRQLASGVFTGLGYTVSLFEDEITFSFLINAEPIYLQKSGFSFLSGPEIITLWNISDRIKWMNCFKGTMKNIYNPEIYYYLENNLGFEIYKKMMLLLSYKHSEYDNLYDIKLNFYIN